MKYKNILQIDDDYDDCNFFLEALEEVSAAAYTAIHNPVHALQKLINNEIRPDLIFLDINMPFMNGMEVLTEIKKREVIKNIPIIIFSTSIPLDIKTKIRDLGAIDFYTKPNDFKVLKNLLKNLT
ncbi:response regulator [Flavobacterium aquidurense]|uniref:Response regulator with CheY-like receiver, AAA-type ATPase, and DNA-binding domain n=1 Tax=Flavobacterium aquidurense TaxID=362413 RepID=A0A0Q0X2M7_9FLAO|nr:response regulator [Flavobacterium aquidurense]KQB42672.1 Response regulator with CheY-like receiver, AAA-type ATPase, and DNA-binding domain [Flavobacterium aquidurense]